MVLLGSRSSGCRMEAVETMTERPYEPKFDLSDKLVLAALVALGLLAAFGWLVA